ncbi:hypothetical protein C5167_017702 [Papaver somniferum]|uniref:Uncharacterized protein n=1 Tax=Papaver somniferum TaxID=3469 RepID=A0A4Y7INH8_PAPSO|nr:hypothetical protein C5167_017702 [Papaver somniferum]
MTCHALWNRLHWNRSMAISL